MLHATCSAALSDHILYGLALAVSSATPEQRHDERSEIGYDTSALMSTAPSRLPMSTTCHITHGFRASP